MKKILLIAFLSITALLFSRQSAQATHIIGGEMYYICNDGDEYTFKIIIYRDCEPNTLNNVYFEFGVPFDDPLPLTIYSEAFGVPVTYDVIDIVSFDSVFVEPNIEGLCIQTVPDVCVARAEYTVTAELPPNEGGYTLAVARCCRNESIKNVKNASEIGSTYFIDIPHETDGEPCNNSAPYFKNYPPIVICQGYELEFDHSAIDTDGDSLVYEMCKALVGGTPSDVLGVKPPFDTDEVEYVTGYSEFNPLGADMQLDPVTGLMTVTPTSAGKYVVTVCVSEYRDGELLSTNRRDFQFNVAQCEIVLAEAGAGEDVYVCKGDSYELDGQQIGGEEYYWSPGNLVDDSTNLEAIIENLQQDVTLSLNVFNNSVNCDDTDEITLKVVDEDIVIDVEPCIAIDGEKEFFTINFSISGGFGAIDPDAKYTVSGTIFDEDLEVLPFEIFSSNPVENLAIYDIMVVDAIGCSTFLNDTLKCEITVPVELISFEATIDEVFNANEVSWVTASEINTWKYTIDYAFNQDANFTTIYTAAAAGNSHEINSYLLLDKNHTQNGIHYYRLNQYDTDGQIKMSKTTALQRQGILTIDNISPNPATDFINISVNGYEDYTNGQITVYNVQGQVIENFNLQNNTLKVNVSDYQSGLYFVELRLNEERFMERFVKH